jgi:hypothetical protein
MNPESQTTYIQPEGRGPKPKTFEDGIMAAVKVLDIFKRHPSAHFVPVQGERMLYATCPDLCKFQGKRNCVDCKGWRESYNAEPGVVSHILYVFSYPAVNPLARFGFEVEEEKQNPLTDMV